MVFSVNFHQFQPLRNFSEGQSTFQTNFSCTRAKAKSLNMFANFAPMLTALRAVYLNASKPLDPCPLPLPPGWHFCQFSPAIASLTFSLITHTFHGPLVHKQLIKTQPSANFLCALTIFFVCCLSSF